MRVLLLWLPLLLVSLAIVAAFDSPDPTGIYATHKSPF
jgi:hypothetical protein